MQTGSAKDVRTHLDRSQNLPAYLLLIDLVVPASADTLHELGQRGVGTAPHALKRQAVLVRFAGGGLGGGCRRLAISGQSGLQQFATNARTAHPRGLQIQGRPNKKARQTAGRLGGHQLGRA